MNTIAQELESPSVDELAQEIFDKQTEDLGELVCYWCKKPIIMGQGAKFLKSHKKTKIYHKKKCFDLADAASDNKNLMELG